MPMIIKQHCRALALVSFFFMFLFARIAFAQQEINIDASVDKSSVTVGETITLTVTILSNGGVSISPQEPDLNDFQIDNRRQFSRVSLINGAQRVEVGYMYSLRPIKAGKLTIGKFKLNLSGVPGAAGKSETEPIAIEVREEEQEKNEKPAEEANVALNTPRRESERIISDYLIMVSLFILLIFIAIWGVIWQSARKEKLRARMGDSVPDDKLRITLAVPAAQQAGKKSEPEKKDVSKNISENTFHSTADLNKILEIRKTGDFKHLCSEISRYVKAGSGVVCGENFSDLTTAELLGRISSVSILNGHAADLDEIMSLCDMVSYAKYNPDTDQIDGAIRKLSNISHIFERGGK